MATSQFAASRGVALVTGASGGIGEQIALLLARAGYDLILVGRNEERLSNVRDALARDHRVTATPLTVDLAEPGAAYALAERVHSLALEVEILVNNAGYGLHGRFDKTPARAEVDLLQVNVTALVELTKIFLPPMVARGHGRVLNLASTAAFVPGPFMAAYYASKAFVLSFSQAINAELRDTGVTVTAVCPGPTATNFATAAGVSETPLFRSGAMSADAVADAAVSGMMAGKPVVIPGFRNKLLGFGARLSPRQMLVGIARRLNEARA